MVFKKNNFYIYNVYLYFNFYFIIFRNKKINSIEPVAIVEILEIDKNNNTYLGFEDNIPRTSLNNNTYSGFEDMIPRTSLNNNTVPYIYELFNSRELYIEEKKMTRKYIEYIRPINQTEEEQYNITHHELVKLENFDKREDEYDYLEFAKICLEEKLIDSNNVTYENKPLISILVSSYNKQDFLIKSIRIIQNQNFINIEILIVDDCSTDNSSEIYKYLLKSYPRIRIFHHLKNMGLWRTQIDALLYSKAKYI